VNNVQDFEILATGGCHLGGAAWFLVKKHPLAGQPGWPQNIHLSSNELGMLKVYDADSGATLFWFYSDPDAYPIRIEKQDDNHWIVVFEKVEK
jgi:hypothetical protein